jgi:hypothetical protein
MLLTIRYLGQARHRRASEEEIWQDALGPFAQYPFIKFAYPPQ